MKNLSSLLTGISRNFYLICSLCYMGGIFALSSLQLPKLDTEYPKIVVYGLNLCHFPLYFGLGVLLVLGFRSQDASPKSRVKTASLVWSMLLLTGYGIFDEYHQSWTGRTPSVTDLFTDLFGGLLAAVVLKRLLDGIPRPSWFFFFISILALGACSSAYVAAFC